MMAEIPSLEELIQRFVDCVGIRARAQFAAGDILIEAVRAYGTGVVSEFAEAARRTRRWCEMCLAVSRAVPHEMREEFAELPWTVFRFAVQHQDVKPVREWLELAAEHGLSERQLATLLKGGELSVWSGVCECGARFNVHAEDAAGDRVYCPLCQSECGVMEPALEGIRRDVRGTLEVVATSLAPLGRKASMDAQPQALLGGSE